MLSMFGSVFLNNKRFLITGCSGFIGRSISDFLYNKGCSVFGITIDDYQNQNLIIKKIDFTCNSIADAIKEFLPDIVIHAAGSSSVGFSVSKPFADYCASVDSFITLLEGIRISEHKPLVVYPSSASVYGNPITFPVKERDLLNPISPYGYHKLISEKIAEEYNRFYSIPVLIVRLFSLFGPLQKKLLIWEMFQKFRNEETVIIEGTGNETRDYLYIDDFIILLLRVMSVMNNGIEIFNFASSVPITVKDMAFKMRDIMGSKKEIMFLNKKREGNPDNWQADISKLQKLIGNIKLSDFDEVLKKCIKQWELGCK